MIKSDEVYNVENLKNLELTKEVFEYFQNIPMPNELKQNLILNLQKLCELEQENKRLKKMTEIAKRESKDQIEKKVETKSKESDIIEWGFKKENKGSLFKTIAAIFCSPS